MTCNLHAQETCSKVRILKTEFNLKAGLADTSKIKIKQKAVTQTKGKDAKLKEVETEVEVHKVQILDPATGTGTFLAETVRHIYKKYSAGYLEITLLRNNIQYELSNISTIQ